MKKTLMMMLLASTCSIASAQTGGLPPEQAPAGDPGKLQTPKQIKAEKAATAPTTESTPVVKPMTTSERRAARKAKREVKVGDKPLD